MQSDESTPIGWMEKEGSMSRCKMKFFISHSSGLGPLLLPLLTLFLFLIYSSQKIVSATCVSTTSLISFFLLRTSFFMRRSGPNSRHCLFCLLCFFLSPILFPDSILRTLPGKQREKKEERGWQQVDSFNRREIFLACEGVFFA